MDDMEEYTINDDLRAHELPSDDEDDLPSGGEALFGSGAAAAPINVDGSDDASAAGAAGVGAPPPGQPVMPSSTQSFSTTDGIQLKRVRSPNWNDFDEIFYTLPTGKKVRIGAKSKHYAQVLSGCSSAGTGHLLRH
jgi:hypothetical protein